MRKKHIFLLWFLVACAGAHAQNTPTASAVPQITLGQSIVALNGPWKFHTGDNPAWADPNYDDSGWETVDLTPKSGSFDPIGGASGYVPGWTAKGDPGYWGWAWYRFRVRIATRPGQKLAINGPADVDDAYQIFANGRLLGSFGRFPAGSQFPVYYFTRPRMFLLPSSMDAAAPDTIVLALRFWMSPTSMIFVPDAGGMHTAPLLGRAGVVAARYQLDWLELVRRHAATAALAVLFFLLAVLAGSLFFLDRSDPVYRWIAAVFLLMSIGALASCLSNWTEVLSITGWDRIDIFILAPLETGGWAMAWWVWFRLRRPAWMPKLILILTLLDAAAFGVFDPTLLLYFSRSTMSALHWIAGGVEVAFFLLMAWIVLQGIRRQGWEGWLTLPAVVLLGISQFDHELADAHIRVTWFVWGVNVSLLTIGDLLLVAVMFVLLMRRLLLSIRRQREQALDIQQAQEVQQVLIPEKLPHIPGLAIESEYRPAREVGGDFFQIIPHPTDGSVLIVVGDVTGHGLQAGMLVALIVGAIRNQTDTNFDPLSMMQSLNKRLCGRGHAHATGLALRIAADGSATLANAGHLPPYVNGKELPMEGALPLGMMESADFSVMHFQLAPGDRLLLLSDGVVEAQDEKGQLFGFERIEELLRKPVSAAEVAAAAQNFG